MSSKISALLDEMNISLFMDGANKGEMVSAYKSGEVSGFTTNPTLMREAGIIDYAEFAKEVLAEIKNSSISFEVFSDDFPSMEREARLINSWGGNTCIKIPITNTKGESSIPLIRTLTGEGMSVNVTAVFTLEQVKDIAEALNPSVASVVSIFAGRIADTGVDPMPVMRAAKGLLGKNANAKLLWASPRELLNLFQAEECGCDIITATNALISKISNVGKDLNQFSLETVTMFHRDAKAAGYCI